MRIEEQQLLELVSEYRAAVIKAVVLLNAKSEKDKGFQFERAGYLDDSEKIEYQFHGIGCLVITQEFKVDFDFDEGGRCDGIQTGFLLQFLDDNKDVKKKYASLAGYSQIETLLQDLEAAGIFTNNLGEFNEWVFYLVSTIDDPATPVWRPNWPENMGFDCPEDKG